MESVRKNEGTLEADIEDDKGTARKSKLSKDLVKNGAGGDIKDNNNRSKQQNANVKSASATPGNNANFSSANNPRPPTSKFATTARPSPVSSAPASERVKVIVRCRPLSKKEETQGHCS